MQPRRLTAAKIDQNRTLSVRETLYLRQSAQKIRIKAWPIRADTLVQ
jgi:hypothetical protein